MLSQRAKYALRAMICLASHGLSTPVPVTMVAREAKIPRAFLEQIFAELRRRNLVVSHRGKQGGFVLAREPKSISFADIIRHIDGPLALAPCASRTAYRPCADCVDVETCQLRPTLIAARDAVAHVLEHTTLAASAGKGGPAKMPRLKISK